MRQRDAFKPDGRERRRRKDRKPVPPRPRPRSRPPTRRDWIELCRRFALAPDLDTLLAATTDAVVECTASRQASVRLLDETGRRLLVGSRSGPPLNHPKRAGFAANQGFQGWVIEHRTPAYTNNPASDPRFEKREEQFWMPTALGAAPLVGRDGVIGVVSMVRVDGRPYDDADLEVLELIASLALASLANLRQERLARTDPLTLLPNARALAERRRRVWRTAGSEEPDFAWLLLDIDQFGAFNERYGYVVGDAVLQEVARRVQAACRTEDVVYRKGGEEFLIWLEDTAVEEARVVAERIREAIAARPFESNRGGLQVTASLGVAAALPGERGCDLFTRLDDALKRAKGGGRNRVELARTPLGRLGDGTPVYGRVDEDHLAAHPEAPRLLPRALREIPRPPPRCKELQLEIDLGEVGGMRTCVATTPEDDVVYARRIGRTKGMTRFVLGRSGEACSTLVVRIRTTGLELVELQTAYVGRITPQEPWHERARVSAEALEASVAFWSNHALVWDDRVELDPEPTRDPVGYWPTEGEIDDMRGAWREGLAEILKESTVYRGLEEGEIRALAQIATLRKLEAEGILWQWGEPGDGLAVVLEGALLIRRLHGDRGVEVFRRMGRGEMVGFSTVAGEVHTADVVADGSATVAVLPTPALKDVLRRHPDIALATIAYMGHLVGLLSDERAVRRGGSVEAKLCRWLRTNHAEGDTIVMTHEELAHLLDASRENVSRALKRLERRGALELGRGRFKVVALHSCKEP